MEKTPQNKTTISYKGMMSSKKLAAFDSPAEPEEDAKDGQEEEQAY